MAVKRVRINLEELYESIDGPSCAASALLSALLQEWGAEYKALVNLSPDAGIDVVKAPEGLHRKIYDIFADPEATEEEDEEVAKLVGAKVVVELYDGYESALAFI